MFTAGVVDAWSCSLASECVRSCLDAYQPAIARVCHGEGPP